MTSEAEKAETGHISAAPVLPRGKLSLFGAVVAIGVFAADQASKLVMQGLLPEPQDRLTVLPVFDLVHAWNYGVSFSMFTGAGDARRFALIAVMLAISGAVLWWLHKTDRRLPALAYGLILGGALGNVCDRVWHGAVFDFLYFHLAGYGWPAFNLADSAIVCGVGLLLLDGFRSAEKRG